MLLEPVTVHTLTVVDDDDCRVLVVQIGRQQHLNPLGARVKGVGDQLLNSLIRAGVKTLGEQLDDPIAQADIDAVSRRANGRKGGVAYHN